MSIRDSLFYIRENILNAEIKSGRKPGSVKLMAVSKFHSKDEIKDAVDAGITLFGENRLQEAEEKFTSLISENPHIHLHMIGSLQRNKVKKAVKLVSCIQSVDRIELIHEIQKHAQSMQKKIDVFFEYNTGEESKAGFKTRDELLRGVHIASESSHIECKGFMTMAPFCSDIRIIRTAFAKMRDVAETVRSVYPTLPLLELSMGMSNDYTIAIEEGATLVRVGTALFGERK